MTLRDMDEARGVLVAVIVLLAVLSALLVMPFLQFFLLAVLLAFLLRPLQDALAARTSQRIAAATLVGGATVVVIVPLVVVLQRTLAEATTLLEAVREGEITFARVEARVLALTGIEVDLAETLRTAAGELGTGAVDNVLGVFGTVSHLLIGVGLTLFLLYYLLKDDDRFFEWLFRTVPVPEDLQDELYGEIEAITWAVLAGHVFVAVIQGLVAGVGLVVAGVPNAVFWTVVMVVLAVLPVVGSFVVWGPASLFLLAANRPVAAAGLFLYGTVVVGLTDDYLRPIVVDRYARLNPAVIIVGILGGIYVIGFMGIFFGPIVIGSLRAVLDVYRREYLEGSPG